MEKFFLMLPPLGVRMWTAESYFLSAMSYGYATKGVMFLVTFDFLFTALYYSISIQLKSLYEGKRVNKRSTCFYKQLSPSSVTL
jgi:hypothetical protein